MDGVEVKTRLDVLDVLDDDYGLVGGLALLEDILSAVAEGEEPSQVVLHRPTWAYLSSTARRCREGVGAVSAFLQREWEAEGGVPAV